MLLNNCTGEPPERTRKTWGSPTFGAMSWQQEEQVSARLGIIAPSRAPESGQRWIPRHAAESLNRQRGRRFIHDSKTFAPRSLLQPCTKIYGLSTTHCVLFARPVGVSMKLLRSCAPRIPRCAALCAYAEQPCNHFCGDRQKRRQSGDGGYHEKLKGNELDRDSSISPTFYLGYMARMTSNVKHKKCAFPYHSRQQLFTTESLFIYFSND